MTDDAGETTTRASDPDPQDTENSPAARASTPGEPAASGSPLLVEDLLLLLLDDDGASIRGAGTLYHTLGGAVLVELALLGRLEVSEDDRGLLNGPVVRTVGDDLVQDPLLQDAFEKVARAPQRVQPLLVALGADLWRVVLDRLVSRGLIAHEERRVLKIFRTTRWPAQDEQHEAALRRRVLAVLVDGEEADARTAATIGLLYASGAMPALSPPIPWTSDTVRRAQELQAGSWGAGAVATAVERTAAAIAAATAVTSVATVTAARG